MNHGTEPAIGPDEARLLAHIECAIEAGMRRQLDVASRHLQAVWQRGGRAVLTMCCAFAHLAGEGMPQVSGDGFWGLMAVDAETGEQLNPDTGGDVVAGTAAAIRYMTALWNDDADQAGAVFGAVSERSDDTRTQFVAYLFRAAVDGAERVVARTAAQS